MMGQSNDANWLTFRLEQLLDLQGFTIGDRIGTYVDCSSSRINDQHLVTMLLTRETAQYKFELLYLEVFTRLSVGGTEVETCLPLGHEVDSGMSLGGVGDDLRLDGSSSELTLLRATPSVWMSQHELNLTGY